MGGGKYQIAWYKGGWGVQNGGTNCYAPNSSVTEYTVEELRQKFPLPGERVEAVEYTHEYSDFGIYKSCSVIVSEPDSDGFVVVHDKHGCYRVVSEGSVRPLRTDREKFVENVRLGLNGCSDYLKYADEIAGQIYDAIKSGAIKAPEAE